LECNGVVIIYSWTMYFFFVQKEDKLQDIVIKKLFVECYQSKNVVRRSFVMSLAKEHVLTEVSLAMSYILCSAVMTPGKN
jgi:hypothetical protein